MRFAPQTIPAPGAAPFCAVGSEASSGLEPCDVLHKYASSPSPCGCPAARPSPRSRSGVSWIMRASTCQRIRNELSGTRQEVHHTEAMARHMIGGRLFAATTGG
jgi:hypothetical protein